MRSWHHGCSNSDLPRIEGGPKGEVGLCPAVAPEFIAIRAIAPGDREFRIVSLVSASATLDPRRWAALIDLSLIKAGERYAGTPGLPELARYGHFTSPDQIIAGIAIRRKLFAVPKSLALLIVDTEFTFGRDSASRGPTHCF